MTLQLDKPLGAPGIYSLPDEPIRALTGVRMDVCAFVGVAPRGPAREPVLDDISRNCKPDARAIRKLRRTVPVPVESFPEYRRLFGGFEGPGLLPYAVASFFDQGGRRAYIARIVHQYPTAAENAARVAQGTVSGVISAAGPLILRARNEGKWGNRLRAEITFSFTPVNIVNFALTSVAVAQREPLPAGTLLRLDLPDGTRVLRFIIQLARHGRPNQPGAFAEATFDTPVSAVPLRAEVVEAELAIDDGDGRTEVHQRLGLSPQHPRWMASVLCHDAESRLVYPHDSWVDTRVTPDPNAAGTAFTGGIDAFEDITPEDFFDASWTFGDDEPGDGITALTHLTDLSQVVVPDLYSPWPLSPPENITEELSLAGPTFQYCVDLPPPALIQELPEPDLDGLRLDPQSDLDLIEALQLRLVEFASQLKSFIVLLDMPPGLTRQRQFAWRAKFDSPYAAAYHPWLKVARPDDRRDVLVRVPPSSIAAGIIAQRELLFGVPHGPANALATGIVDVLEPVSAERHDELHPLGVNVFLRESGGVRLTAARTLSRDPAWRQLSVRRLVTMIRRTLEQQTQWMVFEPNNTALRSEIRTLLTTFLRRLFRAGAFRGASEEEAFFVQCDAVLNPPYVADAGQVIAHIGIAPSEPIEFIVLRLTRGSDGTLTVED